MAIDELRAQTKALKAYTRTVRSLRLKAERLAKDARGTVPATVRPARRSGVVVRGAFPGAVLVPAWERSNARELAALAALAQIEETLP